MITNSPDAAGDKGLIPVIKVGLLLKKVWSIYGVITSTKTYFDQTRPFYSEFQLLLATGRTEGRNCQ